MSTSLVTDSAVGLLQAHMSGQRTSPPAMKVSEINNCMQALTNLLYLAGRSETLNDEQRVLVTEMQSQLARLAVLLRNTRSGGVSGR